MWIVKTRQARSVKVHKFITEHNYLKIAKACLDSGKTKAKSDTKLILTCFGVQLILPLDKK